MNVNINSSDMKLINKIGERLKPIYEKLNIEFIKQDFEMDMIACHLNGCNLDLKKLLNANDFTFNHDIAGIRNNLNRETGELDNFFVPRCAAHLTPYDIVDSMIETLAENLGINECLEETPQ